MKWARLIRFRQDIRLARATHARVGAGSAAYEGCDIILGGHDHFYYVSKVGPDATSWDGYDVSAAVLGAEEDDGVIVVKSGTDFRDLSEIQLDLEDSPDGSVRKRFISKVKGGKYILCGRVLTHSPIGIRHSTKPDSQPSQKVSAILDQVVGHITGSLSRPVCKLDAELDCRSVVVRMGEVSPTRYVCRMRLIIGQSASGNWLADVILHAYDDALCVRHKGGADAVFICGGTIRGDSIYGLGEDFAAARLTVPIVHEKVILPSGM